MQLTPGHPVSIIMVSSTTGRVRGQCRVSANGMVSGSGMVSGISMVSCIGMVSDIGMDRGLVGQGSW